MGKFIGSGSVGSAAIQTSVADQEILPVTTYRSFINFQLVNDQACTISVNGATAIYLRAGQGVSVGAEDYLVYSVKIVESGITFNWIATHLGAR